MTSTSRSVTARTSLRLFVGSTNMRSFRPTRLCRAYMLLSAVIRKSKRSSIAASGWPLVRLFHPMSGSFTDRVSWHRSAILSWIDIFSSSRIAHSAAAFRSAQAASRHAIRSSLLNDGYDTTISSIDSPSSRFSNNTSTGTRVPRNTGRPPRISGSRTKTFSIFISPQTARWRRGTVARPTNLSRSPLKSSRHDFAFAHSSPPRDRPKRR